MSLFVSPYSGEYNHLCRVVRWLFCIGYYIKIAIGRIISYLVRYLLKIYILNKKIYEFDCHNVLSFIFILTTYHMSGLSPPIIVATLHLFPLWERKIERDNSKSKWNPSYKKTRKVKEILFKSLCLDGVSSMRHTVIPVNSYFSSR